MEQITISQAQKHTSPNPIALVCTQKPDGSSNLAAVSWWTYLSNKPPVLGFALSNKGYTGELLRQSKQVVLALPGTALAKEAFLCGCCSGRDTNKAEKYAIALESVPGSPVLAPRHSKLVFACQLESTAPAGDHTVYICAIDNIYYRDSETQLFSWEGYADLRPIG